MSVRLRRRGCAWYAMGYDRVCDGYGAVEEGSSGRREVAKGPPRIVACRSACIIPFRSIGGACLKLVVIGADWTA